MEYKFVCQITTTFNDGGGNSCTYIYDDVLGATDPTVKMSESQHYRPKLIGIALPKVVITLTSTSRSSVVGAPAATQNMDIEVTGKFTLPANTVLKSLNLTAHIETIEVDLAVYDGSQRIFAEQIDPVTLSIADATGNLITEAYDATKGVIEAEAAFDELPDYVQLKYDTGTFDIDTTRISDLAVLVGAAVLWDTDFALGKSIEQGLQMLMVASGLQKGKYGALIGSVSEYLRSGEFGDLDLPLEVITLRVSS